MVYTPSLPVKASILLTTVYLNNFNKKHYEEKTTIPSFF
jgi:hypothetical protein